MRHHRWQLCGRVAWGNGWPLPLVEQRYCLKSVRPDTCGDRIGGRWVHSTPTQRVERVLGNLVSIDFFSPATLSDSKFCNWWHPRSSKVSVGNSTVKEFDYDSVRAPSTPITRAVVLFRTFVHCCAIHQLLQVSLGELFTLSFLGGKAKTHVSGFEKITRYHAICPFKLYLFGTGADHCSWTLQDLLLRVGMPRDTYRGTLDPLAHQMARPCHASCDSQGQNVRFYSHPSTSPQ